MLENFDVLVVGAGLSAGSAIARLIASAPGARILIIDSGCEGAKSEPSAPKARIVLYDAGAPPFETDLWWTDHRLGGAANLWYGQISRFDPVDFEPLGFPDHAGSITFPAKWPIRLDALVPYYETVESILSPVSAGPALDPGQALPSSWTFRREVGKSERLIFDTLKTAGWAPYAGATCLGGRAWSAAPIDPVTLAPIVICDSTDHPRNWVSHTRAAAQNDARATLWSATRVMRLDVCGGGFEVVCDRNGEAIRIRARKLLLACGVLETVNLLRTAGLARGARLGRAFTFTTEVTAYVATDVPQEYEEREAAIASIANVSTKALYFPDRGGVIKGGKISIYDARGFEGAAYHRRKIAALTGLDPDLASPPDRLTLKFSFKGESVPWDGKRIEWGAESQPLLHYTPHAHDQRLAAFVRLEFCALAELFPGGRMIGVFDNVIGADRTSAHLHGGATSGYDPITSVLDPDCAVWGAPGLYVADASSMPMSGATNSSLTVMANAMRVADALARRL